jgi:hypothetical protein
MYAFPLSQLTTGITRLRDKGGASPTSLYDLLNGYLDASGTPTSRDGTSVDAKLPTGTKGLCTFQGKKHVFALTAINPGRSDYVVDILIHPNPAFTGTLKAIHFAKPFLGFLYVVAEFSDGNIYHYWLQSKAAWTANTIYKTGDAVRPTVVNADGTNPSSGATEPTWIASEGALVTEDVDTSAQPSAPAPAASGSPAGSRYDNSYVNNVTRYILGQNNP